MKRFLVVLFAMVLAGCTVAPPRPSDGGRSVELVQWQVPPAPERWSLDGRAAIRVGDDGGTMSVRWRADGGDYRLDMSGALGAGAVRLEGDDTGVTLRTRDGRRTRAPSARALLRRETGYDLPVAYLRWWVRGLPAPGIEGQVRLNGGGHASELHQGGWTITYGEYRSVGRYRLPARLSVDGDGVSVRLAVRRWEVDV